MEQYQYGYLHFVEVHVPGKRRQPLSHELWVCVGATSGVGAERCGSLMAAMDGLGAQGWLIEGASQGATPEWVQSAIVSAAAGAVVAGTSTQHFMRRRTA